MARCDYCAHFKRIYMPAIGKYTVGCDIVGKKNRGCKGNFEERKEVYERETEERGN